MVNTGLLTVLSLATERSCIKNEAEIHLLIDCQQKSGMIKGKIDTYKAQGSYHPDFFFLNGRFCQAFHRPTKCLAASQEITAKLWDDSRNQPNTQQQQQQNHCECPWKL